MNSGRLLLNLTKKVVSSRYPLGVVNHVWTTPKCHPFSTGDTNRAVSTVQKVEDNEKESLLRKVLTKIPFLNVNRSRLMAAGYLLYEGIADEINYVEFFEELNLPDTFYSWFVITELHVWMLAARVMADGEDGKHLRNFIIEAMWQDVAQRVKQLGAHNPAASRQQIQELSEQLQAALIAYDEGLQSNDLVLAGALWRRFYQQGDMDPENIEVLVKYVRKQMRLLDTISKDYIVTKKRVKWVSLIK